MEDSAGSAVAGCWFWFPVCGKSSGCFRELKLHEICPHLPHIPSSLTCIHDLTEDVKSLCLAGKHNPLLPHSSTKLYNQTGLIPQGFNDRDLRPNKSSRQENSISIAWGIWLHSHSWLPEHWKMEGTLFLSPAGKTWYRRTVMEGWNTTLLGQ